MYFNEGGVLLINYMFEFHTISRSIVQFILLQQVSIDYPGPIRNTPQIVQKERWI